MDLSEDDEDDGAAAAVTSDETSGSSRFVVSTTQDLSAEEIRAQAYGNKQQDQSGERGSSQQKKEDYGSFLYWREPLQNVDIHLDGEEQEDKDREEDSSETPDTVISVDVRSKTEAAEKKKEESEERDANNEEKDDDLAEDDNSKKGNAYFGAVVFS